MRNIKATALVIILLLLASCSVNEHQVLVDLNNAAERLVDSLRNEPDSEVLISQLSAYALITREKEGQVEQLRSKYPDLNGEDVSEELRSEFQRTARLMDQIISALVERLEQMENYGEKRALMEVFASFEMYSL